ncbi:hypothetical protein SESBI_39619 [Sesbania bispinosa]|nr:hypothetical protein SESBI_39619 [Sesbania bispinosa]
MYQGALKKNKFHGRSSDIHSGKMRDSTVQNFHQSNGGSVEAGAPSAEEDFASSIKAATEVPRSSFEFYVWSDEGINLHVDLNSSPSDWTNRFTNEENQSAVSAELTVDVIENLMPDRLTVSAEVSDGALNNFISGAESCAKDTSKKILDSDATNTSFNKSPCDSVGNSLSDPGTLELQNSKPDNECSEDCALPNDSCIVNPGVVCVGASLSCSVEPQNSEVASCHKYASVSLCDNDRSLDLSDPKNTSDTEQGGLVNSSGINFITEGSNFPSLTEEWEVSKIVDGRESSECSKFDDPLKKSSLDSDDQDSKMELRKKRKIRDSEIQGSSGKPVVRILRSMKNTAVMVLPRRSLRLIAKVL